LNRLASFGIPPNWISCSSSPSSFWAPSGKPFKFFLALPSQTSGPLQSQAVFSPAQPFRLFLGVDENCRHGFVVNGPDNIVRLRGEKRKDFPVAFHADASLLSRLFGEALAFPRPPDAGEASDLDIRRMKPRRVSHGFRE
jgi:hypothetical protein